MTTGAVAAFEANQEREENSEQHISGKQLLQQLRRQIFVPGAGRFFVAAAIDSWREQQDARWLPTVTELRTEGYMLKHFAKLETEAKDAADCIRRALLTGSEPSDIKELCLLLISRAFSAAFPGLRLRLVEAHYAQAARVLRAAVLRLLGGGSACSAVGRGRRGKECQSRVLRTEASDRALSRQCGQMQRN